MPNKRGMSVAMETEIGLPQNQPCHLVEITVDSGGAPFVTYLTDFYRNLTWGGNEYIAVGTLLGVTDITETSAFQIHNLDLSLSGVDSSNISLFMNNYYLDQPAKVYLAMVDSSGAVAVDPILVFDGNIDTVTINEDPASGKSEIKTQASSHFVDFQRKSGRHTTDSEQQYLFPGDLFFQPKLNKAATKEWGK